MTCITYTGGVITAVLSLGSVSTHTIWRGIYPYNIVFFLYYLLASFVYQKADRVVNDTTTFYTIHGKTNIRETMNDIADNQY